MSDKIRVLIVDDIPETRENVRKLLQFESDLEVIGHAGRSDEGVRLATEHKPDIVLMDINMPDTDGITASQIITNTVPGAQIIIMSVQSEADYLRRAMLAGARDFLMKPFSGDELVDAVRRVYETRPVKVAPANARPAVAAETVVQARQTVKKGKTISVFSPKGGIGCTTVAINLAVALAESKHEVLLVDGSFQFGDIGVMLDLRSMMSIIDVIEHIGEIDPDLVSSVLAEHDSGLKVLLAPPRPEMAELVKAVDVRTLLEQLREMFDFVVIDTSSSLTDVNIAMLDAADRILLIARQNLPSLSNVSRFFDLSEDLDYDRSKVMLVINHGSKKASIGVKDIEDKLKWPASAVIPEEPIAYSAANQGKPLLSNIKTRQHGEWRKAAGARAFVTLANRLLKEFDKEDNQDEARESNGTSRLAGILGR